jgi:hypothetical protein
MKIMTNDDEVFNDHHLSELHCDIYEFSSQKSHIDNFLH